MEHTAHTLLSENGTHATFCATNLVMDIHFDKLIWKFLYCEATWPQICVKATSTIVSPTVDDANVTILRLLLLYIAHFIMFYVTAIQR